MEPLTEDERRASFGDIQSEKRWEVYELSADDEVSCAVCQSYGKHDTFKRGESYLCPPAFFSEDADYICKFHLEHRIPKDRVEIVDVYE